MLANLIPIIYRQPWPSPPLHVCRIHSQELPCPSAKVRPSHFRPPNRRSILKAGFSLSSSSDSAAPRRRMGSLHPSSSAPPPGEAAGVPVVLNVYDLTPMNNYMSWFGIGIFHSGIEVHGLEYGFGAHDLPASGVFEVEPKSCPGFVYRCSIRLGHTKMLPSEFRAFIENIAADYHGDTYHLITKNCNHFTNDVALRVTGTPIPGWVNRLAQLGAVCNCLLPESLRVPVVKQTPEYHGLLEDGGESCSINSPESIDSDEEKHLLTPSSGGEVVFVKETQR